MATANARSTNIYKGTPVAIADKTDTGSILDTKRPTNPKSPYYQSNGKVPAMGEPDEGKEAA